MNITNLSYANLDSMPVSFDWYNEDGDAYDLFQAIVRDEDTTELGISCESCGEEVVVREGELNHARLTDCDDLRVDAEDEVTLRFYTSWDGDGPEHGLEGPMMNYYYPIELRMDEKYAAIAIADLPLCLVRFDKDNVALALTGGGMDLSWEICEAFIRLGSYPPVHFCDLPAMAGKKNDPDALAIIEACKTSLSAKMGQLSRTRERLNDIG